MAWKKTKITPALVPYEQEFEITNDTSIGVSMRKIPRSYEEEVEQEILGKLEAGILRHTDYPWAFEAVVLVKKDGRPRLNKDLRPLDKRMKGDAWPTQNAERQIRNARHTRRLPALTYSQGTGTSI